jgi:hypothetical protein
VTAAHAYADALASLHDAGAVRVPPWQALVTALASIRPDGIGATIDWLVAHRAELEAAYAGGRDGKLALPVLPPAMHFQPEIGYLDRGRDDHALRERYLFADLVGRRSFSQVAIYAIAGLELSAGDAAFLDGFGIANLLVDPRAWPMAVTRRVAARGGGHAAAVTAGTAMMSTSVLAGAAAADCARFLRRVEAAGREGQPPAAVVADVLARRQRVMGFGRPLVGPDERVPVIERLLADAGRAKLPFVTLLREVDAAFAAGKGLRSTAAAWAAAILSDFGLSPDAVQAVSNFWVSVCVSAQALYSGERAVAEEA